MRPAITSTVLRDSAVSSKREDDGRPHTFSLKRLLILVILGTLSMIPGIALVVLGYHDEDQTDFRGVSSRQKQMYRALGPAGCTVGSLLLFGACLYYYCYGTGTGVLPQNQSSAHSYATVKNPGSMKFQHKQDSLRRHDHLDTMEGGGQLLEINSHPSPHRHNELGVNNGAPLAASETESIRGASAVPSEVSLIHDGLEPIPAKRS